MTSTPHPASPLTSALLNPNSKLAESSATAYGAVPKPKAESIQWPGLGGYGAGKVEYHGGALMADTANCPCYLLRKLAREFPGSPCLRDSSIPCPQLKLTAR